MAFGTMLLSAITMWWAVDAVGKNDRQMAYLALGLTMFFGVATINATSFLFVQANLPVSSTPGVLIYTITGSLIAMIVIGLVYAAVMTFRTLGGEYHDRDREGLTAAALFWYLTIAAHALVWYAIYVVTWDHTSNIHRPAPRSPPPARAGRPDGRRARERRGCA